MMGVGLAPGDSYWPCTVQSWPSSSPPSSSSREGVVAISVPLSAAQTKDLLADMEEGGDVVRGDRDMAELFGVRFNTLGKQISLNLQKEREHRSNNSGFSAFEKAANGFHKATIKSPTKKLIKTPNESIFRSKLKRPKERHHMFEDMFESIKNNTQGAELIKFTLSYIKVNLRKLLQKLEILKRKRNMMVTWRANQSQKTIMSA